MKDATESLTDNEQLNSEVSWDLVPEPILLHIFQYLSPRELLDTGLTCKTWLRISYDEFLWKDLFYSHFKIDPEIHILPGKHSWLEEYKRLTYHTPVVETEVLKDHTHQVLHVSFSHNGKLFATCSKDGSVLVWDSGYPAKIKYYKDMRVFCWKYTQFCQFNQSDTLLLVSGVHFGTPHSTSGEIAVFSLQEGFNLQCRVVNKPYDIFGTWYSDHYLLSGDLHWLAHLVSSSVLWLNKASQETSSEHVPIMSQLYRFYNCNASSVRAIMVADCMTAECNTDNTSTEERRCNLFESSQKYHKNFNETLKIESNLTGFRSGCNLHCKSQDISDEGAFATISQNSDDSLDYANPIYYNQDYRKVEIESHSKAIEHDESNRKDFISQRDDFNRDDLFESEKLQFSSDDSSISDDCSEPGVEKLLIFSTGSKTFTPHQIGFKKIKPVNFPKRIEPGPSLAERVAERERKNAENQSRPESNWLDYESVADKFDKVDHLIDLHGHIIGMGLSPDHRYLYVNNRPWPQGCVIQNPLNPPPIAQEIDIHVIDLVTLKEVGTMLRSHKAYTPNNECFFIFLNVCNEYVASGAEDKHGYLWDRHYGICLAKYPHNDVVNSVAFNPRDSEMLVTTSDDYTIKVWRSKHRVKQLKIDNGWLLPKGLEIYLKNKRHM
ncbi:hypothetical protein RUM43_008415 [Polyplax serrata]|uniref:F-box domain-containing protein n=1 Tax=Polyplax serrata TaxID=468196 RepID=A0AAN8P9C0_POLSC